MHEDVQHQSYRTFSICRDVEKKEECREKKEDSNELIATDDLCDHSHNGNLHTKGHVTSIEAV